MVKKIIKIGALAAILAFAVLTINLKPINDSTIGENVHRRKLAATTERYVMPYLETRFGELSEPFLKGRDTSFFWNVPKAGGTTVMDYIGTCLDVVVASEVGITENHHADRELRVVQMSNGRNYVNVDTTNPAGISRAVELGFAQSGLADVVVAPLLYEGAFMFSNEHRARMFAMFRHPIVRAGSLFNYFQKSSQEFPFHPEFKSMTIQQYAQSKFVENNFMTRFLAKKPKGPLSQEDVVVAKDIMRYKCLIGLTDHMDESLDRFTRYFGWKVKPGSENVRKCKKKLVPNRNARMHQEVIEGTMVWNLLAESNYYDIQLYAHALDLFEEQRGIPALR
mmetsp:Transcript_25070/g.36833  ORF Transcript_25070/g.36833 Transcript_25070/m.36833 type:complete len:337 (+) Transcript_25070:51-1061(+)|eukprot:CAMPEP_0195512364 /NCGR_PEP_ID=MMETSP0794_2-20130614/4348_1 /TAXON_ID=515487 /ORGANISM="Stephanopyxis turris, Strain CCMP 815" /LENGTH=336 /DNA_ID=CAMNT_0040640131 /DNA_START=45 /DNA_END=1055 /DNA_ORIENTATION=+